MDFIKYKKHLSELLNLSLPILAGNIGQMFIGLGDIYVAGHYHTDTLAAISVATAIFMTFIVAGFGLTSAITPVLSNYRGQKRPVKEFLLGTIFYSQILALIFFILIWLFIPLVYHIGINQEILNDIIIYLKISSFSIFGLFLFASLKEFLQSYEIVSLPNTLMVFAVFINLGLNFLFVYGYGSFKGLGTAGLAIASLIVRFLLAIILFAYCIKFLNKQNHENLSPYIKDLVKTGSPIAGAMFIEFLGFNIVAILVGGFSPFYTACHNIIIGITSLSYMIPFSISCALSVKIGYANGAQNITDIKKYLQAAFSFILFYSLIVITIYLLFKKELLGIFSSDEKIIELGSSIFIMVSCFTLFDAIQSTCIGALKGLKRTLDIMLINSAAYLLISIPLGIILAYHFNMILKGFWIGLSFGIFSASICAIIILVKNYSKLKKEYKPN